MSRAIILLVALLVARCSAESLRSSEPLTSADLAKRMSELRSRLESNFQTRGAISTMAAISATTVPTGYLYATYYSGTTCSTVQIVLATPLGVCSTEYTSGVASYVIQTASGTTATKTYYTDNTCATVSTSTTATSMTTDSCVVAGTISAKYTYSTSLTYPTSGYLTKYYAASLCTSSVMGYSLITNGYCAATSTTTSAGYSCSGSTLTYTSYSASTACSGTSTATAAALSSTCVASTDTYVDTAEAYYVQSCYTTSTTDDSTTCFAGSESVQLENGSMKQISEVSVGDVVLSADSNLNMKYSPVIAVPHKTNDIETSFSNIRFVDERDIMMTPEHLILAGSCGSNALALMAAKKVAPGMCVVDSENKQVKVVSNDMKTSKGLYTIVTNEEYVVINGFVASPFAYNHFVANNFYNVYRMAVKSMPLLFQSQFFMAGFHAFAGLVMSV